MLKDASQLFCISSTSRHHYKKLYVICTSNISSVLKKKTLSIALMVFLLFVPVSLISVTNSAKQAIVSNNKIFLKNKTK